MLYFASLLVIALTNGAWATTKSESELLAENGWKEISPKGIPLFEQLAAKAASNFTKHIDFYQVMEEVLHVSKKGPKHRIVFTYSPTSCSVKETFDAAKCKAVTPKASGECTSMFTVEGSKPENAVLEWVQCEDFMAPKHRRYA
ncbi:uncharacterized protein LOC119168136 [Rhipicephalus microplus]|uniref:Putative cystatin n=1 Tax=Rhipicephalus microplus TaxID=6941 RepID=A0A6G5A7G0_RHIMP|nr:uncharacterized protein LOC119168136 [Rhipicephalus microplus]